MIQKESQGILVGALQQAKQLEKELVRQFDLKDWSRENLTDILQYHFKHKEFWNLQYESILNILEGNSSLVIKTTGAGKSLIYQFSAFMKKGLTIVITPLLSLMMDQVKNMPDCLRAGCINGLIGYRKKKKIWELVKKSQVDVSGPDKLLLTRLRFYSLRPRPSSTADSRRRPSSQSSPSSASMRRTASRPCPTTSGCRISRSNKMSKRSLESSSCTWR